MNTSDSIVVNVLTVNLDIPLFPRQIKTFSSQILKNVEYRKKRFLTSGIEIDIFHNRDENNNNIYRYPLIQYQVSNKKASITGINQGAAALQILLDYRKPIIDIEGFEYPFVIIDKISSSSKLNLNSQIYSYRMFKWLALNSENYRKWKDSDNLIDRIELLNNCLFGHLMIFLENMGLKTKNSDLIVSLTGIDKKSIVKDYNVEKIAFDITFSCNVNLPDLICLGQSSAYGFGKIRSL